MNRTLASMIRHRIEDKLGYAPEIWQEDGLNASDDVLAVRMRRSEATELADLLRDVERGPQASLRPGG